MLNESSSYSMFWSDTLLLFAGLTTIALALILSQRLGNKPVQFGLSKLGLDLKADRLTFVLVVGLMLIGVGVFFRYQDYEAKLEELRLKVENSKSLQEKNTDNLEMLKGELRHFKVYDLGLNIVFPNVPGEAVEKDFVIAVYTKKQDDEVYKRSDDEPRTDFGKTSVKLNNLSRGEKVKIVAVDRRDETKWESINEVVIPETQILMKKKIPGAEGQQ